MRLLTKRRIAAGLIPLLFPLTAIQAAEPTAESSAPAVQTEAPSAQATFDVWEIIVGGNTLLTKVDVERTLFPFLGANKNALNVDAARQQLEQRYRDAGYPTVLVNVPEQEVRDGIVHLQVVEGKIESLRIKGTRYSSAEDLRRSIPGLAEGVALSLPTVQQQLAQAAARSNDRTVTPVLRPGKTPGTVEAELRVSDELPLHGSLEVNNRYGVGTRKWRTLASLRYDNLWQRQHSLTLQYQTAPADRNQVSVFSGTYLAHFAETDNMLVMYGVKSDSQSAALGDLTVLGNGNIIGIRGIVPLAAQTNFSHTLTLGADYKDFKETIAQQGADISNTPINYVNWFVQYGANAGDAAASTHYALTSNFGLRGVGNNPREFEQKRSQGKANYLVLKPELDHSRDIIWNTRLRVHLSAQISDSPLISNEQFSAGGAETVRGYLESQAVGDNGVAGSLEWYSPSYSPPLSAYFNDLRVLGFIDGANLHVREPLPSQTSRTLLLSMGIGLRLTAWKSLHISLDVASPRKSDGKIREGHTQAHASVEYTF